jgi:ABC-type Co2+ transport system permease subunit
MRTPNPWIVIPSLLAGLIAGWVGYVVTDVSCRVELPDGTIDTCPEWAIPVSIVAFLVAMIGMAVVIVLVYRSLAEAAEQRDNSDRAV